MGGMRLGGEEERPGMDTDECGGGMGGGGGVAGTDLGRAGQLNPGGEWQE